MCILLMVHVGTNIQYKRRPEFNAANCFYSLEDLAKFAQFCRDNFIEFVPRWQIGGHANWNFISVHPELREKGYKNTADVTKPEHNKIVFDCILDVIEATKCKYVNVGGDEWWHSLNKTEKPDKLLNGKTRAQAFLDFHEQALEFCKKHNVQLMMHEDMLSPYHNGKRYDIYKIIDEFPKEIIMLVWNGSNPDQVVNYFADKGFRVWPCTTGVWFPNHSRKRIEGFGPTLYSFNLSLTLTGRRVRNNYALSALRGAEYSWNAFSDKLEGLNEILSSGYLTALMEQMAEPYNPATSQNVSPLDISKAYNCNFSKLFIKRESGKYRNKKTAVVLPKGKQDIGNIPMAFAGSKNNCIRIGKGDKITVPVNKKLSSLIFLHTVRTDDKYLKEVKRYIFWRHWPYGRPAGDYIVKYTDGLKAKIPVRLRESANYAAIKPLFRCCLDTRFIMSLEDANSNYLFLYQYEWANPYPEKQIKSITFTQSVVDFDLLLFALSGREARK
ncbi:MAG: family 20 glycosylhydrolase [Lentisphaerae bacterium]|nr:family 20 glycosylhydrolase [Lentisphaerota bacterium]MCP4103515.1 family 20 glycosylhydrolase [Lentisphaerota bacterium]